MYNIFICWSGDRSRSLARALYTHLPRFIPGLVNTGDDTNNLFMSEDISKGTRWFDAVERELDRADAGLVCITREALQSGWIHFEAGALARAVRKKKQSRGGALYTYLLGVQPDELKGPLAEFQSTRFDAEDTQKLCAAVVNALGPDGPSREAWEQAFEAHWPRFEDEVRAIGPMPAASLIPDLEGLFRRKTFNEPLEECTRQSWIDRFTGVRETIAGLRTYRPIMRADNSYLLDIYEDLLGELDGYAMNMGALLLEEKKFTIDVEDGRLLIGNGIKRACESRRGRIRQLVTHLLAPNCAPVLEMRSRRYARMTSFEARKTILIHPAEREIQAAVDAGRASGGLSDKELNDCAASLWEFDRIYYYLVQERHPSPQVARLAESLEQEFEKVRAMEGGASLVPLHYALRALKKQCQQQDGLSQPAHLMPRIAARLDAIERFLEEFRLDKGGQVRENIKEFRALLGTRVGEPLPAAL